MPDLKQLLSDIKSEDMNVRYAAWRSAGPYGSEAVAPLADLMREDDRTIGKAAKMAVHQIVHHAGRPEARADALAVSAELLKVAESKTRPRMVRSDCLYWVGLIGSAEVVPGLSRLLGDHVVREDARLALERLPGDESLRALHDAAATAPPDFKPNLQQSLHNRQLTPSTAGIA